tara:strand:+ start:1202 stop:1705 length:504 start_codon:yes stop_codon:yes gene_type:complete
MMAEIFTILPDWLKAINENSKLDACSFNVEFADTVYPKNRIDFIDNNMVKAILLKAVAAKCDEDRQFSSLWFEKIRRYCEINRPNLKQVSLRRFGKDKVQKYLEFMVLILSIGAYHTKDILLFNALGTIVDFLAGSPFSKQWHQQVIGNIAEAVLCKPELYIGNARD